MNDKDTIEHEREIFEIHIVELALDIAIKNGYEFWSEDTLTMWSKDDIRWVTCRTIWENQEMSRLMLCDTHFAKAFFGFKVHDRYVPWDSSQDEFLRQYRIGRDVYDWLHSDMMLRENIDLPEFVDHH